MPDLSVHIDRPLEDVFAFVMDIPRTPLWRPRIVEAEWLDSGETRVGRRINLVSKVMGIRSRFVLEITRWEPPRRFAYGVAEGRDLGQVEDRWDPENGGCRFTIALGQAAPNFRGAKLLMPLGKMVLLKENYEDLERLKRIMESGADRDQKAV
ncbi:MAG: SRPBCC family protein [Acidimicrobiia bacterium]